MGTAFLCIDVDDNGGEDTSTTSATDDLLRLTAENRRQRDPDRERELVRLRHHLGVSRLQEPGRLPHGSLVRNMVTEPEAERLRAVIDACFAAFDTVLAGDESNDTWYSPFTDANEISRGWLRFKGGVSLADSPRATFDVAEEFHAAGIGTFADEFLGEPAIISLDKSTLRRGGADMGIEWHQDGSFLGTEVRALNVWLALSDCGVDAPSLDVVPFRLDEIVDTGTEGAGDGWSVSDDVARRTAGDPGCGAPRSGPETRCCSTR